jgi:hypothetical protein
MLNASSEIGRRGFALPASLLLGTLHAACKLPADDPFAQARTTHYADAGV